MIIEQVDPTRASLTDYSLNGSILTIGGLSVDLAQEQGDQEVIITIGRCKGMVHRGLMGKSCEYLADVIIPPRKYETVDVEGPGSGTVGSGDEEPVTHTESVPVPLDLDSVILRLWPVVEQSEVTHQQGENNVAE
jgi:hypothetical protein